MIFVFVFVLWQDVAANPPAFCSGLGSPHQRLAGEENMRSICTTRVLGLLPITVLMTVCAHLLWATESVHDLSDVGLPSAGYKLIQEIDCAQENNDILFLDYPAGVSRIETVLDVPCRVLSNQEGDAKYFAYRMGKVRDFGREAATWCPWSIPRIDRARCTSAIGT